MNNEYIKFYRTKNHEELNELKKITKERLEAIEIVENEGKNGA